MCTGIRVRCQLVLLDCNETGICWTDYSGYRVVPCGQTDGRTDMTKLIVAFRNFAKAPKKDQTVSCCGVLITRTVYTGTTRTVYTGTTRTVYTGTTRTVYLPCTQVLHVPCTVPCTQVHASHFVNVSCVFLSLATVTLLHTEYPKVNQQSICPSVTPLPQSVIKNQRCHENRRTATRNSHCKEQHTGTLL
jgi:hypothetical protein